MEFSLILKEHVYEYVCATKETHGLNDRREMKNKTITTTV